MGVRSEISKHNRYYIDPHRYYELKHFCMQYETWKKAYYSLDGYFHRAQAEHVDGGDIPDPTADIAEARYSFYKRMCMIEESARETDVGMMDYILEGVTQGLSYDVLNARHTLPCCKDVYYDLYRKFFWILSHKRQ